MAEAGDGTGHTPLTPGWTPARRASHYPWQGDRPNAARPPVASLPGETVPGAQAIRSQYETGARSTWQPNDYRLVNVTVDDECPSVVSAGSRATLADFYDRALAGSRLGVRSSRNSPWDRPPAISVTERPCSVAALRADAEVSALTVRSVLRPVPVRSSEGGKCDSSYFSSCVTGFQGLSGFTRIPPFGVRWSDRHHSSWCGAGHVSSAEGG